MDVVKIVIFFLMSLTLGCATPGVSNKFSEFKDVNWKKMNRFEVEKALGKPDSTGALYKTDKEALVYLSADKKQPQLIVVYDIKTNQIVGVQWYATRSSDEWTLQQARSKFPNTLFQNIPVEEESPWGERIATYSSSESPLVINMNSQTQKLISLSWQFEKDEPAVRKPTSH
ncbi:hypothetical protein [Bdellovibrio sp.]|uniref:hypothetical protein n=1 Tax=Bdellovibrio sp. TaxID=28201 RepID=UPI0039E47092